MRRLLRTTALLMALAVSVSGQDTRPPSGGGQAAGPVTQIVGPGGSYTFIVQASSSIHVDQTATSITIRWGADPGPGPDPGPDPPPPPPDPIPEPIVKGPLRAVLVFDLEAMTPDLALIRAGAADALAELDCSVRTVSVASTEIGGPEWGAWIAQRGLKPPWYVVMDEKRTVKAAGQVSTAEALVADVKRLRGGK
jgi:hypothetical protein